MNEETKNFVETQNKALNRLLSSANRMKEKEIEVRKPYWTIIIEAGYANYMREYTQRNEKSLKSFSIFQLTEWYKVAAETIFIPFSENGRILVKLWRGKTVWREFYYKRSELAPFLLAYIVIAYKSEFRFAMIYDNERSQIGTYKNSI